MDGFVKDNPLINKSIAFASRIIKLNSNLVREQKEYVLSKQIIRSGTSIGANINEANYAESIADFISKMHIALKETAETEYWLRLLIASEYLKGSLGDSLLKDCIELKKLLIASINTAKNNATSR
ncbi:MAG: four helix bundle protein [Clostridia bacterium]|nr:four helix bundle protein [Clostridia bacterium]